MLTHPWGDPMVLAGLRGLIPPKLDTEIWFGILRSDVNKWGIDDKFFTHLQSELNIPVSAIFLESTESQPETISQVISKAGLTGPIFIKDSDNYFKCKIPEGNSICTYDLHDMQSVNPSNKSYVKVNEAGLVESIVEKHIISSRFCCGGYSFEDAAIFQQYFQRLDPVTKALKKNLYISDMISLMLFSNIAFTTHSVDNYADWGTIEAWNVYKSRYRTLFVDIDGILLTNAGPFFHPKWKDQTLLIKNVAHLQNLAAEGKTKIILTTARKEKDCPCLTNQLFVLGVPYDQIIYGAGHCQRTIINDFANTNPYPVCSALNIKRDSDTLAECL